MQAADVGGSGDEGDAGREAAIGPVVLSAAQRAVLVRRADAVAARLGASGITMVADIPARYQRHFLA